ncbi:hypothetical protein BDD12DRAFT_918443 [Trichophaea hybrida]|nr:hypothetical protein BDD12DRAFT_918443 [Trichophaea hybrida]
MSSLCASLHTLFPDVTSLRDNSTYTQQNTETWSTTTILIPECIFTPTTPQQLAEGFLKIVHAKAKFAVRSGGHMPNPGANSVDEGVLINMKGFDGIEYDENTKVAKVGVGLRWERVYEFLKPYGVVVAGGTNGAPGVGGVTLGGGISFYYGQVGYTADTVVNFQVVLASGKIINANSGQHSDLFWALKGGSNNFGIVTRIDFQTLPTNKIWSGTQVFTGDAYHAAVDAMNTFINKDDTDPKATIQFVMFYDGPGEYGGTPEALKPFTQLDATVNTLAHTTIHAVGLSSAKALPNGLRRLFNTLTIHKSTALLTELITQYHASTASLCGVAGFTGQIVAMVFTHSFLEKSANGPAGIGASEGELICIIHLSTWTSEDDDEKVYEWTKQTTEGMRETARKREGLNGFVFLNDAGPGQDVFEGYQSEKRERLRSVSRKYDEERVFQELQNGGFKIGM